ncbi:mitochondrial Rho GTPase 1-like isoform X2 [Pyrus communis]|uniref:mitochondrial Rho GTPase 1-like isoform X2 n=1 Tax=Pyrus communis TaxID=23211 RepID=UPI0035C22255
MPLVWIELEMAGEGKIIPWSEAPYKDAAGRTASGNLPLNAFLSEWALMTLLNPNRSLANLIYVGYNGSPASAIHVTRRRSVDRKTQKTERNVSCFVFGPKNAGKSPLLNSFIGRPFSKSETIPTGERYAVNVINQIGVEASTNQLADQQMPVYNLASKILCRVINVSLKLNYRLNQTLMKYFHKSLYFPNQIFQNGYVTPCYSSCHNGEGLHGCHSSNSFYFLMNLICLFQRFLWLELQSTSFVANQKLPYLDFAETC